MIFSRILLLDLQQVFYTIMKFNIIKRKKVRKDDPHISKQFGFQNFSLMDCNLVKKSQLFTVML